MTPTPKEGPPTLRECRDALEKWLRPSGATKKPADGNEWYYSSDVMWKYRDQARAIFRKLTDEALERDEKRTAVFDALMHHFESLLPQEEMAKGLNPKELAEYCGNLEFILLDARDKLDALTPDQEES